MKPLIALIAVTTTLAACSEPIAPTRAPQAHAPAANLLDLLHRARLAVTNPLSTVTQTSNSTWSLTKVGALNPTTSNVTWTITATQSATGAKKLVVTGKITLKNIGTKAAPIGNVVVTLQHKPALQWIALASDVATTTAGDAATSAKIVKWTNNSDDSDGVDDDDTERGDSWNVTTMDENSASGPLAFTPAASAAASLAPGATVTLSFTASYDNTVLNLPVGRKVRAQIYVTFGNAGLGLTSAANLDIDGNGTIDADEARARTVTARLGEKVVPAPTAISTPVTLSDAAGDLTTTGTVTYTNAVFTLGARTGTVTAHVAGGASGGTIANCAHLTGTGINLQACNTQTVPATSPPAFAWKNGDVITYQQTSWGNPTHAAGLLLFGQYGTVYASAFGEFEIGIPGTGGHSILFTSGTSVQTFLPQFGPSGPLANDLLNPTTSPGGLFGGDVVALRLNVDFAYAGLLPGTAGFAFGDLTLRGFTTLPGLNGMSVRGFANLVSTLLGGGSGMYGIGQLETVLDDLNAAFEGGVASPFALEHLAPPSFAWKNGDVITYSQSAWGNSVSAAGVLLDARYADVFVSTLGVLEVGIVGAGGFSMRFTSQLAVSAYLPQAGTLQALAIDLTDPTASSSGAFGGAVTSLALNVAFSDAGVMLGTSGARFGDLTMCGYTQPGVNGHSVRSFLATASTALGGGSTPYSFFDLYDISESLNGSFEGGIVTTYARDHLTVGACP